jgi:hypothetical protein
MLLIGILVISDRRLLPEPNVTNDPVRHERLNQLLAKEIAKGATTPGCSPNSESDSDEQASVQFP